MITVDDKDISTTWGLEPYRDNFYSAIMKDAGLKDRIVGDYPDTSGVIIPKGQSYTKSQELVVSFLCDSYDHYFAFLTYCVAQKVVNMYVSETDETLRLEYLACSSFNKAGDYNIFAVKFQEANPTRRYPTINSTSYDNVGGKGNRSSIVNVTKDSDSTGYDYVLSHYDPTVLVNGSFATEGGYFIGGCNVAGAWIMFDFGSPKVIQEAKLYQDITATNGTWQWQASNNLSSWSNIGTSFLLGATTNHEPPSSSWNWQAQTELNSNITSYRYYRLLGISGVGSYAPYLREMEFKLNDPFG